MKTEEFEKLSESARNIIQSWGGFCDDRFYGKGYTDFKAVMEHETIKLRNTGIYDTVVAVYGIQLPYYKESYEECECMANNAAIHKFFQDQFDAEMIYCKWLCNKASDVLASLPARGGTGCDTIIVEHFIIRGRCAVASDMDEKGSLIVSDMPIESEQEMNSRMAVMPKRSSYVATGQMGMSAHSSELLSALRTCGKNMIILDPKNDLKNAGL